MPILAQSSGSPATDGPLAIGAGTDTLAELALLRANLHALAEVVEDLRAKHNAHTHNAAVPAPPPAEQSLTPYTMH